MMKHFFGTVLTRDLNISLGIDILPNRKTCTFDCLYCQVGKTKQTVSPSARAPYFGELKKNFERQLRQILTEETIIDSLIFGGYLGEPTLNSEIGSFLKIIKEIRCELKREDTPITILTNSSTINSPEIQQMLTDFDLIIAKLDSGNQKNFIKVNQPHYLVPPISDIIDCLIQLKKSLKNTKLIIQTLLFSKNSDDKNIDDLIIAYNQVIPNEIQVYSIAQPPAYPVKKLDYVELEGVKKKIEKNLDNKIKIQAF